MPSPVRCALIAAALFDVVEPHAIMTHPPPRTNIVVPPDCNWLLPRDSPGGCSTGTKLPGYGNAIRTADGSCGGVGNNDPGAQGWPITGQMPRPDFVAIAGASIEVKWALTIPHRADIRTRGVRVALHYANTDSFDCNVLVDNVGAGPDRPDAEVMDNNGAPDPWEMGVVVDIPPDKTCDYCVLQFMWAAENDDGFYISCADLAITGPSEQQKSLTEYAALPPERGELPNNPGYVRPSSYTCVSNQGTEEDNGGVIATVVVFLLLAVGCGFGFIYYKRKQNEGGSSTYGGGVAMPSPPAGGGGGLPPGWREVPDPSSGRSYFVNDSTGETTWERPKGGGPPMPPAPPGQGLPPGWTASQDPTTGRTYYVHAASGTTSWEVPSYA